jgi:hypothetical protein
MRTATNRRLFPRLVIATGFAVAGLVAGCDPAAPADPGNCYDNFCPQLRIVNGAVGAVSVFVDGSQRATNMSAGTVSPALYVSEGTRHVEFRSPATGTTLAAIDVTTNGMGRTVVTATRRADGTLKADVLGDTAAIVNAGASKLRVLHLAASAPSIDIWRTQPDFSTPSPFMIPFAYSASSGYLQSTPGEWVVFVTPHIPPTPGDSLGIGSPATVPARSIATFHITIPAGVAKTVVVLDAAGGGVKIEELP